MTAVVAPSILSADFSRLGDEVREAEAGGAGLIHLDVMDGHFVPNLTLGPAVTQAVRRSTELPLDCHLMVQNPGQFVEAFIDAGADMVSVHVEAETHLHRVVQRIRELGAKPGVVLNPATPLSALDEILPDVDYVLLMSVNPGFGGQKLIESVLDKARRLRERLDASRSRVRLEIDGGVSLDNLERVARAGFDIVVAGSAIFGSDDVRATTTRMSRQLAELEERDRSC